MKQQPLRAPRAGAGNFTSGLRGKLGQQVKKNVFEDKPKEMPRLDEENPVTDTVDLQQKLYDADKLAGNPSS